MRGGGRGDPALTPSTTTTNAADSPGEEAPELMPGRRVLLAHVAGLGRSRSSQRHLSDTSTRRQNNLSTTVAAWAAKLPLPFAAPPLAVAAVAGGLAVLLVACGRGCCAWRTSHGGYPSWPRRLIAVTRRGQSSRSFSSRECGRGCALDERIITRRLLVEVVDRRPMAVLRSSGQDAQSIRGAPSSRGAAAFGGCYFLVVKRADI